MAPRQAVRRERNNDYSAVGTAGRRTGVTLPQGKLDENGLEEITGLFSSPTKASTHNQKPDVAAADGQNSSGLTPTQTLSARRSLGGPALPPPRSVSPRKSGIGGSPRRSTGLSIRSPSKDLPPVDFEDGENSATPTRVKPRRFTPSPEKRPLQEVISNGVAISPGPVEGAHTSSKQQVSIEAEPDPARPESIAADSNINGHTGAEPSRPNMADDSVVEEESVLNPMGDQDTEVDDVISILNSAVEEGRVTPVPSEPSTQRPQEQAVASNKPAQQPVSRKQPTATQRQNGKKRKSGDIGEEGGVRSHDNPTKKPRVNKAPALKAKGQQKMGPAVGREFVANPISAPESHNMLQARIPGLQKDPNTHLSHRQQAQLDQIIEKVKARPGKLKTLYVLKREKSKAIGADDVRSGRAVVKPLAYWSAEQCINSDGNASLKLGSRIPLSSVKEITDGSTIKTLKAKHTDRIQPDNDDSDTSSLGDHPPDGHEEEWERQIGVYRGQANMWSQPDQQALPPDETEEVDLAYHPSSILTRRAGGGSDDDPTAFKYAKLISMPFFGSGIVDLPVGAIKRPKNSKSMQMCFFVFKGRVTVRIGWAVEEGECEEFSVGKGGVFQVPRGNRYSIQNDLDKPARLFFSQASETVPDPAAAAAI